MDIIKGYTEIFAGLIILLASITLLFDNIIDPAYEQIEINYNARADKAATFTMSLNEGLGVHDQYVGRIPGVDPVVGYDERDSGLSRMYFRPEQFVMLPAVDTDISSNPNVPINVRRNIVSDTYDIRGTDVGILNSVERKGLTIGVDPAIASLEYVINRDSLYNKSITYNSINANNLYSVLSSNKGYAKVEYGSQDPDKCPGTCMHYGGYNITVDSAIHPSSGKKSNSVIFVKGRVPTK